MSVFHIVIEILFNTPNWASASPPFHLRMDTNLVSETFLHNTIQFTKFRNLLIPSVIYHHQGCLELTSIVSPKFWVYQIHRVALEMKHVKGWTDTAAPLCIHFMHFVQRNHKTVQIKICITLILSVFHKRETWFRP